MPLKQNKFSIIPKTFSSLLKSNMRVHPSQEIQSPLFFSSLLFIDSHFIIQNLIEWSSLERERKKEKKQWPIKINGIGSSLYIRKLGLHVHT